MPADRFTGQRIDVLSHIGQCMRNIMQTPLNTRPMQPDYGSNMIDVVDLPTNAYGRAAIVAATADAVTRWETRPTVHRVTVQPDASGTVPISLEWSYNDEHIKTPVVT